MYAPGTRIGNYAVVSQLGVGGMGAVFHARHAVLGQDVALKVLLPHLATRAKVRARFVREAQVQFKLAHPNIVSVTDFIEQPDFAALVMDLVPGPSLQSWLDRHAASGLAWGAARPLLLPIVEALAFAHRQGVVHRDVKPDNVLLDQRDGAPGVPRVTDFGLAKVLATSDALTKTGARMGSYPYMAPEQFQGARDLDARADVFALGVLLYRVLSGWLPVDPENQGALWGWYMGKQPAPGLAAVAPGAPVWLVAAVDAAMAIERSARPADAAALLRLLQVSGVGVGATGGASARVAPPTVLESAGPRQTAFVAATPARPEPSRIDAVATEQWVAAGSTSGAPVRILPWVTPVIVAAALAFAFVSTRLSGDAPEHAAPSRAVAAVALDEAKPAVATPVPRGFVRIPAGSFRMGSPVGEADRQTDEEQHRVTISRSFFLQATEVTQGQWRSLMNTNPSRFGSCGESCPVENVNWYEAVSYCNALSIKEGLPPCYSLVECNGKTPGGGLVCADVGVVGLSCRGYRLPTEAEWEYAARAGSAGARYGALETIAWYSSNSGDSTHIVGDRSANAYGLHDMQGNVWEWTADYYDKTYGGALERDPTGPTGGSNRVGRGCSWINAAAICRAASRGWVSPSARGNFLGFRPARSIP